MTYNARILADSVAPNGARLTTFELTFPRIILAEFNTHRMISRNAASSRAIPIAKMIERVQQDPFIPEFCKNQKGMQAAEPLEGDELLAAKSQWKSALYDAIRVAQSLTNNEKPKAIALPLGGNKYSTGRGIEEFALDVHKQWANRLLEPWMWTTIIASATDWENLFHLRCHPAAQPEFQKVAVMARDLYRASEPHELFVGDWHLPLFPDADYLEVVDKAETWESEIERAKKISTGRCARVSYLTHEGKRDFDADSTLCERLAESGHWSPFEHVATPCESQDYFGNFRGWKQFRKEFENENVLTPPEPEAVHA